MLTGPLNVWGSFVRTTYVSGITFIMYARAMKVNQGQVQGWHGIPYANTYLTPCIFIENCTRSQKHKVLTKPWTREIGQQVTPARSTWSWFPWRKPHIYLFSVYKKYFLYLSLVFSGNTILFKSQFSISIFSVIELSAMTERSHKYKC